MGYVGRQGRRLGGARNIEEGIYHRERGRRPAGQQRTLLVGDSDISSAAQLPGSSLARTPSVGC